MVEARTAIFNMRITPEEREAWREAALQSGMTMTGWVRALANTNLGSALTEGEPMGVGEAVSNAVGIDGKPASSPSVSDEPSILAEATALIRDKDGVEQRVDLLRHSGREFHPDPKPAGRKRRKGA